VRKPVRIGVLRSPTQQKVLTFLKMKPGGFGAKEMSRLSFMLLIVTGLVLTVYFGAAAWRLSDDSHMDITGHIPPSAMAEQGDAAAQQFVQFRR
jgi:hypothetical protein